MVTKFDEKYFASTPGGGGDETEKGADLYQALKRLNADIDQALKVGEATQNTELAGDPSKDPNFPKYYPDRERFRKLTPAE